jgi:hypothetical protein
MDGIGIVAVEDEVPPIPKRPGEGVRDGEGWWRGLAYALRAKCMKSVSNLKHEARNHVFRVA